MSIFADAKRASALWWVQPEHSTETAAPNEESAHAAWAAAQWGGPTLDGYPTVFVSGRPEFPRSEQARSVNRVLTRTRIEWLMLLHAGPRAWHRKRGKVQDDCQTLGWTEWAKDDIGEYLYDTRAASTRVMERLTQKGHEAIDHLIPGRRVDARPKRDV